MAQKGTMLVIARGSAQHRWLLKGLGADGWAAIDGLTGRSDAEAK